MGRCKKPSGSDSPQGSSSPGSWSRASSLHTSSPWQPLADETVEVTLKMDGATYAKVRERLDKLIVDCDIVSRVRLA